MGMLGSRMMHRDLEMQNELIIPIRLVLFWERGGSVTEV